MIEIFVDADACPVKEEIYRVAGRYALNVVLVANSRIAYPAGAGVEMVVVPEGPDLADDWIAAHVRPSDVVVTADIPLAARCLEAGARAVSPHGREFTRDAIGGALAARELNSELRESGVLSGGPPPIASRDRSRFLSCLDQLVQKGLSAGTRS